MSTESLSQYTVFYAALLLPGTFFLSQALALIIRITLGKPASRAWRWVPLAMALVYSVLLGTNVTPLVHTLSQLPAATTGDRVAAQYADLNRPMPWLHWWSTTNTAATPAQG